MTLKFWCFSKKLTPLPADPRTIALYLSDRASNNWEDSKGRIHSPLVVSSLQRRLTAIRQAHLLSGNNIDFKNPIITETWKGIRKSKGISQVQKNPITIEILRNMIEELDDSTIGIRDKAILLLGFSGAFRRSEIASLNVEDLEFRKEGYLITLRRSKTDQEGEGRKIGIPYGSNPLTCPVRALNDWLEILETNQGPLFRRIDKHCNIGKQNITCKPIARIIKRNPYLRDKHQNYSGHSLRAGFATTAAQKGIPEHLIMRQTGHKKSDTLRKYIREGNIWRDNPASKIDL